MTHLEHAVPTSTTPHAGSYGETVDAMFTAAARPSMTREIAQACAEADWASAFRLAAELTRTARPVVAVPRPWYRSLWRRWPWAR